MLAKSLQRVIGADVRPGEGRVVAVFFLDLMLMMTAFYVLKVISEPLILAEGGALARSYARGVEAAIVIAILPGYVLLARHVDPSRLVVWLDGAFALSLLELFVAFLQAYIFTFLAALFIGMAVHPH